MPNFEAYTGRPGAGTRIPTATITQRGFISLSAATLEMLGSPAAVVYLWDATERMVGFRAAAPGEQNSYAIRAGRTDRAAGIASATAFCNFIGLDRSVSRRYPVVMAAGVPSIDLKQEGTVVTSNRARARSRSAS